MNRFRDIVATHISHPNEHLKVAVLDTGIDMTHPDFDGESRLKTRRSWVGSAVDVDSCGHGTHIVSTILRLTRNVDVCGQDFRGQNHPDSGTNRRGRFSCKTCSTSDVGGVTDKGPPARLQRTRRSGSQTKNGMPT